MPRDSSSIHRIADPARGRAGSETLDGFVSATAGPGVSLREMQPLTSLVVQTRNTRYRIIVSNGDDIIIQGGTFFPDPTSARLEGASLGASLLKVGWIGVGLRMEIRAGGQRIVTTTVRAIEDARSAAAERPH